MKYKFHPLAVKELEISANWYNKRSLIQSKKFIKQAFKTVDFICRNPKLYHKIKGEKRAARVKNFPFSVIYIADNTHIFIVSVFHHSRNPNIWKKR